MCTCSDQNLVFAQSVHSYVCTMAGYEVSTECVKVILQISITNKMCYLVDDAKLH